MKLKWSALLVAFFVHPFAGAASVCDEASLNSLLFADAPTYTDVTDMLNAFILKPQENVKCLEAIQKSQLLTAQTAKGKIFRDTYLAIYEHHFESNGERSLILTPELEILRRIYAQVEVGNRRRGEAPPKEWEIRQRALSETLTRFGLPKSMNASDFEQYCRNNTSYYVALEQFRRLENRLRETMTSTGPTVVRTPDQFKAMMVEQLNQARVRNLQAAAREATDWHSHTLTFKDVKTGEQHVVRIEDLSTLPMQFLPPEAGQTGEATLTKAPAKAWTGFGTRLARQWVDYLKEYYQPLEIPQSQSRDIVQMTASDGRTFFIAEKDFLDVLDSLSPKDPTDFFGEKPASLRFRVEAPAREVQLTDAIGFLRGMKDRTFEDLYKRTKRRIDDRIFDQDNSTPSLTFEINIATSLALEPSVQADVLWAGWRLNPQHWQLREKTASRMGMPAYNDKNLLGEADAKTQKRRDKAESKETKRAAWRYLTNADRNKRSIQRGTSVAAKTAAILAAGYLLWNTDLSTVKDYLKFQLPTFNKPDILPDIPKPDISLPWDFSGFFNLFGGDSDLFDMGQKLKHNNYRFPEAEQGGDGKGGSKTLNSAHDPASSPYAVEVLWKKKQNLPIGMYYNVANNEHVPAETIKDLKRGSGYPYGVDRISGYQDMDIAVDVNFRNRVTSDGNIGLLQMKGYSLSRIELYDWKRSKVPTGDYTLFTVLENRQNFAHLNKSWNGPFTYRAYYHYEPETYNQVKDGVSQKAIIKVNGRLQSSGFTELSTDLAKVREQNSKIGVDLGDLAFHFHVSASYTFKGKTWSRNSMADPAFYDFTQFLNEGVLNYQCTGSNKFFQAVLNETFKEDRQFGAKAIPLVGYMGSEDGVKRGAQGHLHTLVLKPSRASRLPDYLELDATPSPRTETQAERKPKKDDWVPIEKDPHAVDMPGVLPERTRLLHEMLGEGETQPEQKSEIEERKPERLTPTFKPRSVEEIERILKRVRAMRKLAVDAHKPVFAENSWLKNHDFTTVTGLRLLALSNRMLEAFEYRLAPNVGLAAVKGARNPELSGKPVEEAIAELDNYFKLELTSYRKEIEGIEKQMASGKSTAFDFLLNDPVRSRNRELAEILAAYPWGHLLEQYVEALKYNEAGIMGDQVTGCDKHLKKAN